MNIAILKAYASLERRVLELEKDICSPFCSTCDKVCCKTDFCRDTLETPFLVALKEQFPPSRNYCTDNGWLSKKGCVLQAGRPPVCYEFLCNRILDAQRSPEEKYLIRALSRLLTHVGKRAIGSIHLVEIMNAEDLERINRKRFMKQLSEAEEALGVIITCLNDRSINVDSLRILSRIAKPQFLYSL